MFCNCIKREKVGFSKNSSSKKIFLQFFLNESTQKFKCRKEQTEGTVIVG